MNGRNRTRGWLALIAVSLGLITACGGGEDEPGGGPGGAAPAVVKWGTTGIQGTSAWAVHLVAIGQGYFDEVEEQFGTELEFSDVGTSEALQMLDSGVVDVLGSAFATYATARVQGFDFTALVEAYERPNIAIVAGAKYEADRGSDLAAFEDAKWGYVAPGSSTEAVARVAVSDADMKWEDLETVAFGQLPAGVSSLESGRLDLVSVDVGSAGGLVASGAGYVVYNSNEAMETIGGGPIATSSFVDDYPDLTQALVDAYLNAMNTLHEVANDPDKVLALFPKKYQDLMRDGFAEAWVITEPGQRTDGRFDEDQIEESIDFLVDYGYIDKADRGRLDGIWTNDLVESSSVTVER